jgi:hypothetical protein
MNCRYSSKNIGGNSIYLALKNLSRIINKFTNTKPKNNPANMSDKKCTPSHSLDKATIKIINPNNNDKVIRQKGLLT